MTMIEPFEAKWYFPEREFAMQNNAPRPPAIGSIVEYEGTYYRVVSIAYNPKYGESLDPYEALIVTGAYADHLNSGSDSRKRVG